MGERHAPIETVWFDVLEVEVVAGTVRYTLFTIERDEEERTVRVPRLRILTTLEAAERNNLEITATLRKSGHPRPKREVAEHLQ